MFEVLDRGLCSMYFPNSAVHVIIGTILALIMGYLLGSLNFAVIISGIVYHDDVRTHGSKGAGATNMLRTYGRLPAAATFFGDGLKAAVSVFIGVLLLGYGSGIPGAYIGGLGSIIGHAFPLYYGFKGGKSIAAGFFMVLCTSPVVGLICIACFAVITAATKYVSLGSVVLTLFYPFILYIVTGGGPHIIIAAGISVFIIWLHRANIKRLYNGTENKLSFKKTT